MRAARTDDAVLVSAALTGDRHALEELLRSCLPLVYTIVRRGLGDHPDVDDVVQETLLRVLRQLPAMRSPAQFRSWVAAIAVRQVGTHLRRSGANAARTAGIEEAARIADERSPSEDETALGVDLSRQRRQTERASRWLDADNRALLSLWWLELAGELSRAELAAAAGTSVAHAGVRVQRMRAQLEVSRAVVAALEARPGCARLGEVVAGWDGGPGPLWRKRVARHVRSCPACSRAAGGMVATERLLPALALLPVPAGLATTLVGNAALPAAVAAGSGAGVSAGLLGAAGQAVAAHPILATVTAGVLAIGGTATTARLSDPETPRPPAVAAPARVPSPEASSPRSPSSSPAAVASSPASPGAVPSATRPGSLRIGPVSLEAQNAPGRYVATATGLGVLEPATAGSDEATRGRVSFRVVPGLNDAACYSFRYADGRYLRHLSWRLRLSPDEGTPLFRGDATFCARTGAGVGSVALESSNYPGWFLRHRADQLWVDRADASSAFRADSSFLVRSALSE
ncbi:alpha-L-arabinofuranosidase [Actinoplanes sp. ATCC 53533]|uniref:sigma-70 family RNA polymerase sigma factor n=1 Tax=Actinoplanes sp. ATCC 53533 TaxID=1288362 RepID=UPI000F785F2B|nr:sigma-70 family RNA polymerase sigma factor [Actinoplanes sp. ATCC 53533]RSM65567.1 alpha-L-arabinofuranosidase [Actinoplanes sp. ATCC 53533]